MSTQGLNLYLLRRLPGLMVSSKCGFMTTVLVNSCSQMKRPTILGMSINNSVICVQHSQKVHSYPKKNEGVVGAGIPEQPKPASQFTVRSHTCGELSSHHVGQRVRLCGWVHFQRMGRFLSLRDSYGLTQLLVPAERSDLKSAVESLSLESVVTAEGTVQQRPAGQENPALATGEIEVVLQSLQVLNPAAKQLPFNIRDYNKAGEDLQMRHRYLSLRFPELQRNLRLRSALLLRMRQLLSAYDFVEVETPTLFRRTPGGAQEFVVPTQRRGLFYALVQSPQQLKQLLMAGGLDRYFQVARCYRDEGGRSDRQPEFTQLDLELSFTDREGVLALVEQVLAGSWPPELGPPPPVPFPRLTHQQAVQRYGSDKPDLRFHTQIRDVTAVLAKGGETEGWAAAALVFPGAAGRLTASRLRKMRAEAQSDSQVRLSTAPGAELQQQLALGPEDAAFVASGARVAVWAALGRLRTQLCPELESPSPSQARFSFVWVLDFPLFEAAEGGGLRAAHHPFTQPHPADYPLLDSSPLSVRGLHYDLVLNGCEVGGGSLRVHEPALQRRLLALLGLPAEPLEHLLAALAAGCPPHGGIALGLDRLVALLCGATSLRDVIAFPKQADGGDPLSGAPAPLLPSELALYHLTSQ